jgi:hypothetical protein
MEFFLTFVFGVGRGDILIGISDTRMRVIQLIAFSAKLLFSLAAVVISKSRNAAKVAAALSGPQEERTYNHCNRSFPFFQHLMDTYTARQSDWSRELERLTIYILLRQGNFVY